MTDQKALSVNGLRFATLLDGNGGCSVVDWDAVEAWTDAQPDIWVHLDGESDYPDDWLLNRSGIPRVAAEALLASETRPRSLRIGEGLLAILRGVNLNPGAEPEDMVAILIWIENKRIITVRHQRLLTPTDVLDVLTGPDRGPATSPEVFAQLAERLALRMNSVIVDFDERLDEMEQQVDTDNLGALRSSVSRLRHEGVALRRYLGPQRDALNLMLADAPGFFDQGVRHRLRETTNHTLRYLEDLEAARDRAVVILDEVSNKMAESMNRTMYVLSIVAAIFLPLSFLTGLLGINVGGMPGVDSSVAFWLTCAIMIVLLIGEIVIMRKLKWM